MATASEVVDDLLHWRYTQLGGCDPEVLAESLSVEEIHYEEIPPYLVEALTCFRHKRRDARVAARGEFRQLFFRA